MEINAEQIKKALEHCLNQDIYPRCQTCEYITGCKPWLMRHALALITSQEQRIGAQDMTISELRQRAEKAEHDADRYAQKIKELTEENESLKDSNEHLAVILAEETEYKERLQGILLQFTDIVYKWGNKNGYDTSEISLVPILNEESAIKKQIEAETLKKYKSAIIEYYSKKYQPTKEHPIKHTQIEHLFVVLDQIAKEMLEGE